MANTSKLTRDERKAKKRAQRQANKALLGSLTAKERGEMVRSEKTLKGFLKDKGRL
jgi:hypothetical protein